MRAIEKVHIALLMLLATLEPTETTPLNKGLF